MDAETYESEVVTKVRAILTSAKEELLRGVNRTILEVSLRGGYPSTEVVVSFKEGDEPKEMALPIWLPPTTFEPSSPGDTKTAPDSIAVLVYSELTEPNWSARSDDSNPPGSS